MISLEEETRHRGDGHRKREIDVTTNPQRPRIRDSHLIGKRKARAGLLCRQREPACSLLDFGCNIKERKPWSMHRHIYSRLHTSVLSDLCVHAHVPSHTILQKESASFWDMSTSYPFPPWTPVSTKDALYEGLRTGLSV